MSCNHPHPVEIPQEVLAPEIAEASLCPRCGEILAIRLAYPSRRRRTAERRAGESDADEHAT